MGKRRARKKHYKNAPAPRPAAIPAYSLEDILAEYRSLTPETAEAEESGITAEGPYLFEQAPPPPEITEEPRETEVPAEAEATPEPAHEPEPVVEGYDEDGEYASTPEEPPEEPPEEVWEDEYAPMARGRLRPGSMQGNTFRRLWSGVTAMLTVAEFRRQQRQADGEPAPEDYGAEMPPRDAARFYAGQLPSMKRRCKTAFLVTLVPLWISLGYNGGFLPLPGALYSDLRAASLVSLIALLTVMLAGLDVFTSGILSLFRGRPGAETLISVACLGSILDVVFTLTAKEPLGELPPCVLPCVSVSMALLGGWMNCWGYRSSFLALSRVTSGFAVSGEQLLNRKDAFLIKSRREPEGFIRRSEEPDGCESISTMMAPFSLVACVVLSVFPAILNADAASFPHAFAILSALSASWTALSVLPLLYARTASFLQRSNTALAGWAGARAVGNAKHLILTDSDIFPEGTTALSSVRILEGEFTDTVVSYTGSMMAAAGTELAVLFTDLMQRSGSTMVPVEEFTVCEGGVRAYIDGIKVCVGSVGYMHLCGVKIPPTMVSSEAIYTAFNDRVVGFFSISYSPTPSVQAALVTLQRSRRKPIFATRDFNIEPRLIKEKFKCSADGLEFPPVPERYAIADIPAIGKNPVSAVLSGGGLGRLVELSARSRYLYLCGIVFQFLTAGSTMMGLVLGFLFCWEGLWAAVSVGRLLLYMLLWTLPGLALALNPTVKG